MPSVLLIEEGSHETRVAVLEDGRPVEVYIERHGDRGEVGNVYKGRVSRVLPGIQAAFVNIGLERDAFLFVGDLQQAPSGDEKRDEGSPRPPRRDIAEALSERQEILVQVLKEPLPGKGARLGSQVSLPGRFLVLLPGAGGVGISRRIRDPHERQRLQSLLMGAVPADDGVIVRTAAVGRNEEELRRELDWLERQWLHLRSRAASADVPSLVHSEADLALRAVRDLVDQTAAEIWVQGALTYERIESYLAEVEPPSTERVQLAGGDRSLFDRFGVDKAIAKALQQRVWLKSGGFIVISPTEALVAVDVNTGRNTEGTELEATAHQTNLEAAAEIARQIRLRDLSGIIVVDFIDMSEAEHRAQVVSEFEAALSLDRTRTQVSPMSDFGLVAVTRKRTRAGLHQRLTEPCPCCSGDGRVKNPTTVALELGRALRRRHRELAGRRLRLGLHPRVVTALAGEQRSLLEAMQREIGAQIELDPDENVRLDDYQIRPD